MFRGELNHKGEITMNIEERLNELNIVLPPPNPPAAMYNPGVLVDGFLFTAGQTPKVDGKLQYKGKVGQDLTVEDAQKAARLCCLSALAIIKATVGSLDKVEKIVKVTGFVSSGLDFYEQPKVLNGASELLYELFGQEIGAHARSAVGSSALPGNAACEVELVVKIKK